MVAEIRWLRSPTIRNQSKKEKNIKLLIFDLEKECMETKESQGKVDGQGKNLINIIMGKFMGILERERTRELKPKDSILSLPLFSDG